MNETKFACGEICFTDVKWDLYLRPMINRQKIIFSILLLCLFFFSFVWDIYLNIFLNIIIYILVYSGYHIIIEKTNILWSTDISVLIAHNGMNETKFACGEICFTDVKWDLYLRPMINRQKIIFSIRHLKQIYFGVQTSRF
jgi:hypothetical protein